MRFVISERPPVHERAVANWLEATGHQTGPIMLRWQHLTRDLTAADGPTAKVVKLADVPAHLAGAAPLTAGQWADRITARQRAIARRMLS